MGIIEHAEYFVYLSDLCRDNNVTHTKLKTIDNSIRLMQCELELAEIDYHSLDHFIDYMIKELGDESNNV
jgi:hypothetical protein